MVRKRPEALAQAAARDTLAGSKETAHPCASGVSLGRGLSGGVSPSPGVPWLRWTRPTATCCGCLKPESGRESNARALGLTSIAALASVSTLQVAFQLCFIQGQSRTESGETLQCFWGSLLACEQPAIVPNMPAGTGQYNRVSLACVLFHLPRALKSDFFPKLLLPSPLWKSRPSCLQPFDLLSHSSVTSGWCPHPQSCLPSLFSPAVGGRLLSWACCLSSSSFPSIPWTSYMCTCILKADKIVTYITALLFSVHPQWPLTPSETLYLVKTGP